MPGGWGDAVWVKVSSPWLAMAPLPEGDVCRTGVMLAHGCQAFLLPVHVITEQGAVQTGSLPGDPFCAWGVSPDQQHGFATPGQQGGNQDKYPG